MRRAAPLLAFFGACLGLVALPTGATAAQDIGTTMVESIGIYVEVPCTRASRRLSVRVIAVETSLPPCLTSPRTRVIAPDADATFRGSRLVVAFRDMEGRLRTATVTAPTTGAQRAPVVYTDTTPDLAAADDAPANRKVCLLSGVIRPGLAPGTTCNVTEADGTERTWLVQRIAKKVPDFGGVPGVNGLTIYVSTWTNPAAATGRPSWAHAGAPATVATFDLPPLGAQTFDGLPKLTAFSRWSKFSPGGYQGYLKGSHYVTLFGSLTYSGYGVYGPGNRYGAPTNDYGRNVYIDTRNSDYGGEWRRIMGVLTQPPSGTFCYEVSKKGGSKGKTGAGTYYRLTAIGPGLTPVARAFVTPPVFSFGAPGYTAKTMPWGTGFSAGQAQALRDQAAMIGPTYLTKPKGARNTDCGETLRQLPTSFFTPAG